VTHPIPERRLVVTGSKVVLAAGRIAVYRCTA